MWSSIPLVIFPASSDTRTPTRAAEGVRNPTEIKVAISTLPSQNASPREVKGSCFLQTADDKTLNSIVMTLRNDTSQRKNLNTQRSKDGSDAVLEDDKILYSNLRLAKVKPCDRYDLR